ncbi:hypothetical protein [Sulfurovum sp.]|uniref:hypothetical protein n=1 Tax=Sulfurovum sp. TaxID=1969726 RepID=UPI0028681811|nr:hypothetical protein [Sulfurovum sp.]
MNLETNIVPKDIHGIEVDSEGTLHPIIILDNNTAKVSISDDIYEDVIRWICDHLNVDYLHCINANSFEEDSIHNDFKNEGLTSLLLTPKRIYTLDDMKKTKTNQVSIYS